MIRRTTACVVSATLAGGTAAAGASAAYLGALSIAGAGPSRRSTASPRRLRFAIMVPAHDEEHTIAPALDSFHALENPRFSVHVAADNCTDGTADVVRRSGWNVHERSDPLRGKGPALNWLFDRLDGAPDEDFDVAVVVDADTIVDPRFLDEIELVFDDDVVAVQGFYGVRGPETSPTVALRAAALAARHHLRPLGRTRLRGSCGLFGNGMAFRRHILRQMRWSGHLVEDAEMQLELFLAGHRVAYAPRAKVEAEMPTDLERSDSQHRRWELGRLQLLRSHGRRLVARLSSGTIRRRASTVDTLFDLATPPLSVLVATQLALTAATALATAVNVRHRRLLIVNLIGLGTIGGHVLLALASVRAPASVYRSLLSAPRLVWWKCRTWIGVIVRPDSVSWTRTSRNAEQAA